MPIATNVSSKVWDTRATPDERGVESGNSSCDRTNLAPLPVTSHATQLGLWL